MTSSTCEIQKMWRIFSAGKSSIFELRALAPIGIVPKLKPVTKHFRAAAYEDVEVCKRAFEQEALRLNAGGYNIYIVMNPIKTGFTGHAAGDADISRRSVLLIDIDRAVKAEVPATDEEVAAAGAMADEVKGYLALHGWVEPNRVMSGNGHHLYYALPDMPNDAQTKGFVQSLLKQLAAEFDNATVKIDTTVFNASRITKVVGTIARKGMASPGRPYRMARML